MKPAVCIAHLDDVHFMNKCETLDIKCTLECCKVNETETSRELSVFIKVSTGLRAFGSPQLVPIAMLTADQLKAKDNWQANNQCENY